jgi:hypothetical protein
MDEFRVGGVFCELQSYKIGEGRQGRIEDSTFALGRHRKIATIKRGEKGRFEALVRCLELEEKLKKLNFV